jgi:hypothetical protein
MHHFTDPSERIQYLEEKVRFFQEYSEYLLERSGSSQVSTRNESDSSLTEEITRLKQKIEYYEGKVAFLYSSFSWRVTTPLRKFKIASLEKKYRAKIGRGK